MFGDGGEIVSIEHYGASADYKVLYEKFGITAQAVAAAAGSSFTEHLSRHYPELLPSARSLGTARARMERRPQARRQAPAPIRTRWGPPSCRDTGAWW